MPIPWLVEQIRSRPTEPIDLPEPLPVEDLPTPALVLDAAALERNIAKMASFTAEHGKGVRPHAKTHKCPTIARAQLEAGAVGVCVAKVSEAVALGCAGIEQILITSPVTTATKARVVADLAASTAELAIVIDSEEGLAVLAASLRSDAALDVVVDIDIAMGRTGNRNPDVIKKLIDRIEHHPSMSFKGFQHYAGHVMHIAGYEERRSRSLALWADVGKLIETLGINPQIVSGGGTGTYNIDVEVDFLTDLQVGSYTVMDEEYRLIGSPGAERFEDFEVALTMACTTISAPTGKAMTVDGGYKAFASDSVDPVSDEIAGVKFKFAGDEHGVLIKPEGEQSLQLGQVVRLVTPHCDPTVNLHEFFWVTREDDLVTQCWPITGRGCTW